LQKLASAHPEKIQDYLKITKGVEGIQGKNVLIKWLELSFNTDGKQQHAEELVRLTSGSYEFRTRVNAMQALKRLNWLDDELTANLVDAILNPNVRLSGPATDLLKYFYAEDKSRKAISSYIQSGHWLAWQRELLAGFTR